MTATEYKPEFDFGESWSRYIGTTVYYVCWNCNGLLSHWKQFRMPEKDNKRFLENILENIVR